MVEGGIWLDQSTCLLCYCFSRKCIGGYLAGEWMTAVFSHLVIFGEYLSSLLFQLHCSILLWIRRWKDKQKKIDQLAAIFTIQYVNHLTNKPGLQKWKEIGLSLHFNKHTHTHTHTFSLFYPLEHSNKWLIT